MSTRHATTTWPFHSCWVDSTINVGANIHVVCSTNADQLQRGRSWWDLIDCDALEGFSGCLFCIPPFAFANSSITHLSSIQLLEVFFNLRHLSSSSLIPSSPKIVPLPKITRKGHIVFLTFKLGADILVICSVDLLFTCGLCNPDGVVFYIWIPHLLWRHMIRLFSYKRLQLSVIHHTLNLKTLER